MLDIGVKKGKHDCFLLVVEEVLKHNLPAVFLTRQ